MLHFLMQAFSILGMMLALAAVVILWIIFILWIISEIRELIQEYKASREEAQHDF